MHFDVFNKRAYPAIGTSGATVPLLNGTNTWSGVNTYSAQSVLTGGIGQTGTTFSSSSYTHNTLYLAPIVTGAGSGSYNTLVASIQYNSSSDTSGAVNAFQVSGELFGQGGANQTCGIRAKAISKANGGAYTATQSLYGGLFEAYTEGTSSFNHCIGIKIQQPTNAGNVTFQAGIYVANQTNNGAGTITASSAIHIEGKSGTDTAVNGINFGNGTSSVNASIFSNVTNEITITATSGVTLNVKNLTNSTASTVGAAGGASALPATPTGYIIVSVSGTAQKIPYYAT